MEPNYIVIAAHEYAQPYLQILFA